MGFDNQLFSFIRDGQNEGMAITILGSRKSLQMKNRKAIPYLTIHETSQQTERGSMKVDRESATRDMERERVKRRYSRDVDVRYMTSWKNLKDKLLSGYSCNQHQCPSIRERLIHHNQSVHGGRRCETKCTLATSKSKNCVSIRAGPDYDQYSDQKCSDCPIPYTSSSYNKHSYGRTSRYHDNCTKPVKGNLKNDNKCVEGCTSPFNNGLKIKTEYGTPKSRFDEYVDTSCHKSILNNNRNNSSDCCDSREVAKYSDNSKGVCGSNAKNNIESDIDTSPCNNNFTSKNRHNNANGCCYLENPAHGGKTNTSSYMRSGRYVDGCNTPNSSINNARNYDESGCCDILTENPGYTDTCTGPTINYRNACTDYEDANVCATRYVETCTSPSNNDLIGNINYANSCCDAFNKNHCTDNYTTYNRSRSYVGTVEAPRFPIIRAGNNRPEDYQPSTSKMDNGTPCISKTDRPTNTPMMIDNGTSAAPINKSITNNKKNTVDESTGGDSIMSSLMNIVKTRRNSKNKSPKTLKHSPNKSSIDNSTSHSYKPIPPYAINKSSNKSTSDSKLSLKNNGIKNRRSSNPIYKEVQDWIREVPMYPGLEKEAKDKNNTVINDLVKNLYKLSGAIGSPEYDEKVRTEIDTCLNKIPLWYPGAKREQSAFKRSLVDRLTKRLKNVNKKNAGTNYSKRRSSKNTVTEVHTSLTSFSKSFTDQFTNDPKDIEVKICIIDWLRLIYSKTKNNNVLKNQIFLLADFVKFRINQLLSKPISTNNQNIILKTAILNIMNDLPIIIDCPINGNLHIQELAEDLTNKLISIQAKYINCCKHINSKSSNTFSCLSQRETAIRSKIRKCFEDANVDCNNMVIKEAGVILNNCYEIAHPEEKRHARNEIMNILVTSTNLSEAQAWNLAKVIVKKVRKLFDEGEVCESSQTCSQLRKEFTTSVYTSIEEASPLTYLLTSTPKKKRVKKEIPKLNPLEIQYMENVAKLIRTWINTLPESFGAPNEQEFKETMINDLAGDIMDEAKLEQLAPDPKKDKRVVRKYIVCRWIFKLGAFEFQEVDDKIETFLNQLHEIPVPTMTQPQHGNRQAMENLKFYEGAKWVDNYVPAGTDVLEDEISIWMNQQPSNIFTSNDKQFRQDKIHELVKVLEMNTGKKRSQKDVSKGINKWLNQIVKPENKREITELTENLKDIIIGLPQDATLTGIVENRSKIREEHRKSKMDMLNTPKIYVNNSKNIESPDQENTMAVFISKFIEHHYDIDDPLARRAFNRLLNIHLLSLNQPTRKEVYDQFEKNECDDRFPPSKAIKELEYIKDISDWLKNLPIDASYNTLGNRERIDFVNSLALSIREVEEDRENNPDAMDYDMYMSVMILEHLKLLPIPKEHYENAPFMIDQLFNKVIAHRQAVFDTIRANESLATTGVNPDNIGDFIEEFIRINGDDIAHDEMKMEAWATRLIREIKKIVPNMSYPYELNKADIYSKLTDVPVPSDETVFFLNLELDYVKEITNWIKNLPLLPMSDSDKDNTITKICHLAEKMVEMDRKTLANPKDKKVLTEFKEYVAKWISELPIDKKQDISLPVIIQQLRNRMEKIKQKDNSKESKTFAATSDKSIKVKKSKSSTFNSCKKNKELSSSNLTDAIEKWSRKLPIKAENDDITTNIKNDVSRKLFQEVIQLNLNPIVNNDDILYKVRLGDEINNIFEHLPQNNDIQKKKDKLRKDIVSTILEIRNDIKEKTAGDIYKQELEKTIDSSIPNPVPCYQVYDPGFEIYKERLVTAFILENFDHGNDAVKMKYETLLRKEIDKYFNYARNRNAIPLSKDQLNNELYSALFIVPIPNEASVINEVEKVKTRCEVEAWFEDLPMREANDLSELLDWDKILSTLSTRIHEIEKCDSKSDSKIMKEIMKWLMKLPLQRGNKNRLEEFATRLEQKLKDTADQRKCVLDSPTTKNKKDKAKAKTKVIIKKSKEDSQIAGPSSSDKKSENLLTTLERNIPNKHPADEIYDIVHTWCKQLPMNYSDLRQEQMLKDDLTTKMIIKISELNANPEIFNDEVLYDKLLGEELERIISAFPTTCDFIQCKAARIIQLKENIKFVKPNIMEERTRYKYKQDLISTFDKILDKPQTGSPEKDAEIDAVRNNIVDDFIQYKFSNDCDERKQRHKINLQNNMNSYTTYNTKSNINIHKNDPKNNLLMKTNHLISELAKLSPNNNKIVKDAVEEIRMKKEIADFFDEIGVPGNDVVKVNYLKESLARKLNDIEINGYSPENENRMRQEILKCLKKLDKDENPAVIEAFVTKLQNNEKDRRMPQEIATDIYKSVANNCNQACPSRKRNLNSYWSHSTALSPRDSLPINFAKRTSCSSQKNPRKYDNKTLDSKKGTSCQPSCGAMNNAGTDNVPNEGEEEAPSQESEETSDEDETTSNDEDNRICLCKKNFGSLQKRRPYCMVPMPMPMRYICEGRDVLNSLWCGGMPLPLF